MALRTVSLIVTLTLLSAGAISQNTRQTVEHQRFEVASVKQHAPASVHYGMVRGGPGTDSPGQLTGVNITLWNLIRRAYNVKPWLLSGPEWLDHSGYDVNAKTPSGAGPDQVAPMLQDLLAERFGLVVHWEARDLPIYELTVAKGGVKMKTAEKPGAVAPSGEATSARPQIDKDGCPALPPGIPRIAAWDIGRNTCMSGRTQTLAELAAQVESFLGRSIVNKTGLSGAYDFRLMFVPPGLEEANINGTVGDMHATALSPELAAAATEPAQTLVVAVERQLGLKLQASKGPIKVLVIDKASMVPTGN